MSESYRRWWLAGVVAVLTVWLEVAVVVAFEDTLMDRLPPVVVALVVPVAVGLAALAIGPTLTALGRERGRIVWDEIVLEELTRAMALVGVAVFLLGPWAGSLPSWWILAAWLAAAGLAAGLTWWRQRSQQARRAPLTQARRLRSSAIAGVVIGTATVLVRSEGGFGLDEFAEVGLLSAVVLVLCFRAARAIEQR